MSEPQPPSYESSESGPAETSHPSESNQPGSTGTGIGERFIDSRGAMGAIHGAGENLRGNVIGALDTLFGGKNEEEARRVSQRGQEEMHSGVQRMRGRSKDTRRTAAAEGPQPQGQVTSQGQPAQPTQPTQQTQPHLQAQPQGPAVQTKEQGQLQPEVSQMHVEEPRQVQQAPPQPVPEKAAGERPGVVDAPSNVDVGRDEQKIPATSMAQ